MSWLGSILGMDIGGSLLYYARKVGRSENEGYSDCAVLRVYVCLQAAESKCAAGSPLDFQPGLLVATMCGLGTSLPTPRCGEELYEC